MVMGGGSAGRVNKLGGAIPDATGTLSGNTLTSAKAILPNRPVCVTHPTHLKQLDIVPLQGCRFWEMAIAIAQFCPSARSVDAALAV